MADESLVLDRLKHVPIRLAGSWGEKIVTTDPPRYVPHSEYAFSFQVESDEAILLVIMLRDGGKGQFARAWRSAARCEWELRLSFFPMDWRRSDAIQVNFEGLTTTIEHADAKRDPRPLVTTPLLDGKHVITSGSILTLACIDAGRQIEGRVLAVAKADTDAKRGRWALKPSLATNLPIELQFILSGATTGRF